MPQQIWFVTEPLKTDQKEYHLVKTMVFFTHKMAEISNSPDATVPGFGLKNGAEIIINSQDNLFIYRYVNESENIASQCQEIIGNAKEPSLFFIHTQNKYVDYVKIIIDKKPNAQIDQYTGGGSTPLLWNRIIEIKKWFYTSKLKTQNEDSFLDLFNAIWEMYDKKAKVIKAHRLRYNILLPFTILDLFFMGSKDISTDLNELKNELISSKVKKAFEALMELLNGLAERGEKEGLEEEFNNLRETVQVKGGKLSLEEPEAIKLNKALTNLAQTLDRMITRLEDSV